MHPTSKARIYASYHTINLSPSMIIKVCLCLLNQCINCIDTSVNIFVTVLFLYLIILNILSPQIQYLTLNMPSEAESVLEFVFLKFPSSKNIQKLHFHA